MEKFRQLNETEEAHVSASNSSVESSPVFTEMLQQYEVERTRLVAIATATGITWEDGEDAVQEAMIYLWGRADELTNINPRSYLYSTVTGRGHDRRRREQRRPAEYLEIYEDVLDTTEVFDVVATNIQLEQVATIFPQMTPLHKEAFMASLEGWTPLEMAKVFNISHAAAKSRLNRARESFKRKFKESYPLSEDILSVSIYESDDNEVDPQR